MKASVPATCLVAHQQVKPDLPLLLLSLPGNRNCNTNVPGANPIPFPVAAEGPELLQLMGPWACRRKQAPRRQPALLSHVW